MGKGPITAVAVAVTPPSSSGGMAASLTSAQCAAEHLPGQERCVWPEIHPHGCPLAGTGCSVCLAAGSRHSLCCLCPLTCWRGCHMCCLLDIRCSSADPGQAAFIPAPPAALTCSLHCRALFFQLWARGWGVSPAPHQRGSACWGCCGFLSKSLEIRSDAVLLAEAICISDIRPASFPRGSALLSWHRALCQMHGPVKHL